VHKWVFYTEIGFFSTYASSIVGIFIDFWLIDADGHFRKQGKSAFF